jgi:hypothetical protein
MPHIIISEAAYVMLRDEVAHGFTNPGQRLVDGRRRIHLEASTAAYLESMRRGDEDISRAIIRLVRAHLHRQGGARDPGARAPARIPPASAGRIRGSQAP